MAAPVATPCKARATSSQLTPSAKTKAAIASNCSTKAPASTRRRPTKVREPADRQQRQQERAGVDSEDQGQRDRREVPAALVDEVERRRGAGRGKERDQRGGEHPEADPAAACRDLTGVDLRGIRHGDLRDSSITMERFVVNQIVPRKSNSFVKASYAHPVMELEHPAVEDLDLPALLFALSDPARLAIVRQIAELPTRREVHLPVRRRSTCPSRRAPTT